MAGSRRSPLNDQWRVAGDTRDERNRDRPRPRGSFRDRGRDRFRDKDRRRRPHDGRDPSFRSPPPRPFPQPDYDEPFRPPRDFSPGAASARGSPGHHRPFPPSDYPPESHGPGERDYPRDVSPSAPPPKRKRTRSPSPGPYRHHPNHHPRGRPPFRGDRRGGRFPGRGRAGRRSPRRGRERRPRGSWSPVRGSRPYNPRRRFRSPYPEDDFDEGPRYRSLSRDSMLSRESRVSAISRGDSRDDFNINSSRPGQFPADDQPRSPSPLRPSPDIDVDNAHEMDQRPRFSRPHREPKRYSKSPRYGPSNPSQHGSPPPPSPHSGGRGSWTGQQPPYLGHSGPSSPYRQSNYPMGGSEGPYYRNQSPGNSYSGSSHRGSGYRGGYQSHADRRFSASGPPSRGRGGFYKVQRGGRPRSPHVTHGHGSQSPPPSIPGDPQPSNGDESENSFRLNNRPSEGEGEGESANPDSQNFDQPPMAPSQESGPSGTPNRGGKISFAFKAKTGPVSAPKPVPDLAQRMLAREPPPRAAEPPREPPRRMPLGPPPKFKPDPRFDRRNRDRDRDWDRKRDRDRDREAHDRRDFREPPPRFREPRDRKEDRRFDSRRDRRRGGDRRPDFRHERRPERSPEPKKKPPRVLLRPKPRPTLPEEYAKSDSVYFRKPGNESVIGAGTYGKVFKAIHVYTEQQVALKKIRMEGEKDGFPVTAVREIKLLQHLRHHNIVSLLEVMVEKNECFMVFEYSSHDLTGLINHPTFTLTPAHKKDLAKQMFEGLNYLHHRGVLHRDIKAANILISNTGLLKYADFGLARFFSKSRQLDYTNRVITIWYRPPELLLGETRYGPAVDVWSAACVYVEMFTKKAVFPGEGGEISQLDKLYNSLGTPTRAEWPDIAEMPWFELMRPMMERKKRVFEENYASVLSPAALDMVSQIFQYDPAKRPTAEQVLSHPYFTSEEPQPQQAYELESIQGDWHEFESKALRKEKDKQRRAEYQQDKEKRKAGLSAPQSERDTKRVKPDGLESHQLGMP